MELTVRVQVFSGRPNPSWILEGATAEDIAQKCRQLEPTEQVSEPVGMLGYNGCIIDLAQGEYLHLVNGTGYLYKDNHYRCMADNDRKLEATVLRTAPTEWETLANAMLQSI